MEQRRLRLGDILDDYCPRERRVTNHAVVAMIEDDVKQTRCTTCDTEHAYKGARVPRRKRTDAPAVLYKEVLASMPDTEAALPGAAPVDVEDEPESAGGIAPLAAHSNDDRDHDEDARVNHDEPADGTPEQPAELEDGPVHRPLIRATLPRPEGQKTERPLPEFTIRQNGGRGGNPHFRGLDPHAKMRGRGGPQGPNGNRGHGGPRFAGARPAGQGRGPGGRPQAPGFRSGQPRKKRSR